MKDYWKIDKLHEWKDNPRNISPRDFERLKKQITKLGQYKPLLVTKDGEVIGGNMRLKAYRELGVSDVWVSVVTPKDENEKLEYALSDNDRAGYYDDDMLANLIPNYQIDWSQYAVDMKPPEDIQKLIDRIAPVEEDEAPEVDETETISKLGEVYQLGRHRLMCGDATKKSDVGHLMGPQSVDLVLTDPPYGINAVGKDGKTGGNSNTYRPVIGDNTDMDVSFLLTYAKKVIIWGGNYLAHYLPRGGRWLVWDKQRAEGLGFSDCELAWTNLEGVIVVKYVVKWDGWRREEKNVEALHPTMKSVKMLTMVIKDYSRENDVIQDVFGGSGSTLIACEQTNRICYMMELDPKYCDVIRKRYAKFIGKEEEWQTITPLI